MQLCLSIHKMWNKIKENFKDFAKNTSLHGVKFTVQSTLTLLEKIFWILVLISSLSLAGYLTTLFWTRYTSNPTRTTLKTAFAPATTVPFPAVTICNQNRILESKLEKFLRKLDGTEKELFMVKNILSLLLHNELMGKNEILYNVTELDVVQNVLDQNDYSDTRRVIKQISQRCEDLILRCAWNKQQVQCKDIFEESFASNGRCCSFNYIREKSGKTALYTLYYGLSTGLRVLLRPENSKSSAGVEVIVHSPEDAATAHQNIRNYLSMSRVNYMQIDGSKRVCSKEVKVLPISHRKCLYSDEKELRYFAKYTDTNCMSVCEAIGIYKICGCIPYYFDFINDKPICNVQKLPCLRNIKNVNIESCGCRSQCEDEFYDLTMTSGKFVYNPNMWMMDFLEGINNTENSILLNVFFSTNRQTVWLRDTMTSGIYLISSFGGIYSLFLGCSIITLVEILYYAIGKCIINTICYKKGKIKGKNQLQSTHKCGVIFTLSKDIGDQPRYGSNPIMPFVN